MITRSITLCGVPYQVTLIDGQVIFLNRSGFAFTHSQFTFEWCGTGWYLVDTESSAERVYVPHIVAAFQWCRWHFPVTYVGGKGTVEFSDVAIKNPQD